MELSTVAFGSCLKLHRYLSLGILAHGHRLDPKVTADGGDAGELLNRQKNSIDWSVAGGD